MNKDLNEEKTESMNSSKENENNIEYLDRFMLANGAIIIDMDITGDYKRYYMPVTGKTTYNPIADGVIKPEDLPNGYYEKIKNSLENVLKIYDNP